MAPSNPQWTRLQQKTPYISGNTSHILFFSLLYTQASLLSRQGNKIPSYFCTCSSRVITFPKESIALSFHFFSNLSWQNNYTAPIICDAIHNWWNELQSSSQDKVLDAHGSILAVIFFLLKVVYSLNSLASQKFFTDKTPIWNTVLGGGVDLEVNFSLGF